jgi:molybdopterin-guanine dinucleotide biosynthesis protein A
MVLAGGRSLRMGGGDKTLSVLGDRPVLAHVLERLVPQCGRLAINANGDPSRFEGFGLPVVPDSLAGHLGPLAGLLAAMDWAAGLGEPRVVVVAADTPFLPADLVARLSAAGGGPAIAASGQRHHPTVGLWPVDLRADLRAALAAGERRLGDWALRQGAEVIAFAAEEGDPFFNINRPEDLAEAEHRLQEEPRRIR